MTPWKWWLVLLFSLPARIEVVNCCCPRDSKKRQVRYHILLWWWRQSWLCSQRAIVDFFKVVVLLQGRLLLRSLDFCSWKKAAAQAGCSCRPQLVQHHFQSHQTSIYTVHGKLSQSFITQMKMFAEPLVKHEKASLRALDDSLRIGCHCKMSFLHAKTSFVGICFHICAKYCH